MDNLPPPLPQDVAAGWCSRAATKLHPRHPGAFLKAEVTPPLRGRGVQPTS